MDARKITGGLFVLCLLLCKESRESDNICINLFVLNRGYISVGGHFVYYERALGQEYQIQSN
jgi:hypothetical protein